MPRASRYSQAALAAVALAAAALVSGCARQDDAARGPAVERSGAHGSLHYRLRSQITPPRVTLGDRAVWRLSASLSDAARTGTLLRDDADSSLEIVPLEPPSSIHREGSLRWSTSLELRGYDIGRVPLPRS